MARPKIVTYDLNKPGQDYEGLLKAIRAYPHAKVSDSCWIVGTSRPAGDLYDELRGHMDKSDTLFVGTLAQGSKWGGCPDHDKILPLLEREY